MVTLIKHYHVKLLDLDETMPQNIIELFFSEDENIELLHLVAPILVLLFA